MRYHAANRLSRRRILATTVLASGALVAPRLTRPAAALLSDRRRPAAPFGVQAGEVTEDRALVRGATDRPAPTLDENDATARSH